MVDGEPPHAYLPGGSFSMHVARAAAGAASIEVSGAERPSAALDFTAGARRALAGSAGYVLASTLAAGSLGDKERAFLSFGIFAVQVLLVPLPCPRFCKAATGDFASAGTTLLPVNVRSLPTGVHARRAGGQRADVRMRARAGRGLRARRPLLGLDAALGRRPGDRSQGRGPTLRGVSRRDGGVGRDAVRHQRRRAAADHGRQRERDVLLRH